MHVRVSAREILGVITPILIDHTHQISQAMQPLHLHGFLAIVHASCFCACSRHAHTIYARLFYCCTTTVNAIIWSNPLSLPWLRAWYPGWKSLKLFPQLPIRPFSNLNLEDGGEILSESRNLWKLPIIIIHQHFNVTQCNNLACALHL